MRKKKFGIEQIISKLRQVEILLSKGNSAKVLTEMWRKEYNTVRPPAPLAVLPSYEVQKKIYGLLT